MHHHIAIRGLVLFVFTLFPTKFNNSLPHSSVPFNVHLSTNCSFLFRKLCWVQDFNKGNTSFVTYNVSWSTICLGCFDLVVKLDHNMEWANLTVCIRINFYFTLTSNTMKDIIRLKYFLKRWTKIMQQIRW